MANTYTKIHLHFVFGVKYRRNLIHASWKNDLFKYITGIVQNHDHKMLAINGMPDHVHMLIGMRPNQSISDLMQDVKGDSSKWINKNKFCIGKFEWQQGFGAFSYAPSELKNVINYIERQEEHHSKKNFVEEYRKFLEDFDVDFDERYIFRLPE